MMRAPRLCFSHTPALLADSIPVFSTMLAWRVRLVDNSAL
jgi:hypothetical protein